MVSLTTGFWDFHHAVLSILGDRTILDNGDTKAIR